jgi:RNA polymerase sigma-70 factor (ECF subfamily)
MAYGIIKKKNLFLNPETICIPKTNIQPERQVRRPLNESKLIRRIQKHAAQTAADTLIRKYYDEICLYAYRQTSDKQTAMDLTQDIFISMLKTIARYDGKQSGFRTWLYRIATNKIIDRHRSSAVTRNKLLNLDDVEIPDETDFTRRMENADLAARIQTHVGTFDADSQRVFRLKIYGGYTFAEIAGITEMPEPTVKTKYYRLLKILREEFGDEYNA